MVAGSDFVELDLEGEALFRRELAEGPLHMLLEAGQRHVADLDRDGAGFDLRQVEDVVDEVEQVGSGAVDGARELGLLVVEVALLVVGQQLRQDQQRVERRAQLVAHIGQELGLVLRGQRELLGLLLDRAAGHVDLEILGLDLALLIFEQLRLFLQLLVGGVQLFLLGGELGLARLQLLGQQLRLGQQALGAHRRGDGVEHDADGFHQLVEEAVVGLVELLERGQLDHRLDLVLEQRGQDVDVDRRRLAEARADLDEVAGHLVEPHRPLVGRGLADQPFAQVELLLQLVVALGAIAGDQLELGFLLVRGW